MSNNVLWSKQDWSSQEVDHNKTSHRQRQIYNEAPNNYWRSCQQMSYKNGWNHRGRSPYPRCYSSPYDNPLDDGRGYYPADTLTISSSLLWGIHLSPVQQRSRCYKKLLVRIAKPFHRYSALRTYPCTKVKIVLFFAFSLSETLSAKMMSIRIMRPEDPTPSKPRPASSIGKSLRGAPAQRALPNII